MSILKKAENKMAYAKVGLYGTAGSGKTRTAVEIAIGLHKAIGSTKPIAALETPRHLIDNAMRGRAI